MAPCWFGTFGLGACFGSGLGRWGSRTCRTLPVEGTSAHSPAAVARKVTFHQLNQSQIRLCGSRDRTRRRRRRHPWPILLAPIGGACQRSDLAPKEEAITWSVAMGVEREKLQRRRSFPHYLVLTTPYLCFWQPWARGRSDGDGRSVQDYKINMSWEPSRLPGLLLVPENSPIRFVRVRGRASLLLHLFPFLTM